MEVLPEVDLKANWRTVGSSLPNPEQSQEDDVSLMASLVRDLVIVAVALVVWLGYAQWSSELSIATDDWLRTPVGIVIVCWLYSSSMNGVTFPVLVFSEGHTPITKHFGQLLMFQFNLVRTPGCSSIAAVLILSG